MDDPDDPVFLSTLYLGRDALTARHPALEPDADGARVLRSVLMKPEHEQAVDVAARARRGPGARRAGMTTARARRPRRLDHQRPRRAGPRRADAVVGAVAGRGARRCRSPSSRATARSRATCWPSRSRAWTGPTTSAASTSASTTRARPTGTPTPTSEALRAIAAALAACSERLLLCTLPADLGRPRAAPKPRAASAIVRAVAARPRRRARRARRPRRRAVAAARRGPPHRPRAARDRRPRGPRAGRRDAPVVAHRGPRLAPRPRALRRPLGRAAGARPAPARCRARPRALAARRARGGTRARRGRDRDHAGHARRLDGEASRSGSARCRRAPARPPDEALAAHGDRDRRAPAVEGQRAARPPAAWR